tara:strand:- start:92 stop:865 length:774 start_codon:yes stop_codon:yes gene_type:complete
MGYISKLIKPTPNVATMIQSNKTDLAYGAGDVVCDWTPFDVPKGAVKLESITLLVTGENGSPQGTVRDVMLYFAKSDADGTAPTSLGTGNATANGVGFYNNVLGHVILDLTAGDANLDFATIMTAFSHGGDPLVGHTNLVLQGEPNSGATVNMERLYVGVIGGGSFAFDFSTGVIADGAVTLGAASTFDVTSGGTDANKVFNPGDVILVHDSDTPIGTVKSVTANNIVLESATGVAIANTDEIMHQSPIKIRLGLQY